MRITVTDEVAQEIRTAYAAGNVTYRALGEKYGLSKDAIRHTARRRRMMGERYLERFWGYVSKGPGCWLWQGTKSSAGYGQMRIYGRLQYAHRLAWEWTQGPLPDKTEVCHICDNPSCVNPAHLFLGTHKDNMQDMSRKGRWTRRKAYRGEENGNARLTLGQVGEIRQLYANGFSTQRGLARQFGVGKTTIGRIVRQETWLDKPEPPSQ